MKKVFLFIALIIPVLGSSQGLNEFYHSDDFLLSYMVLPSSIYNPDNDTTIAYIEFYQDTTTQYKVREKTLASIDPGQPMDINYAIGFIGLFQATEYTVNVVIRKVYKYRKETTEMATIHFDDLIAPEYGIESAMYGTLGIIKKKKAPSYCKEAFWSYGLNLADLLNIDFFFAALL